MDVLGTDVLEVHLKCKLDHPRSSTCRGNSSERRWHCDVVVRICEVCPVEKIEELRAKLCPHRLGHRNELNDREVYVLLSRTVEEISRRVSKRIVRIERRIIWRSQIGSRENRPRRYKCCGVEIPV